MRPRDPYRIPGPLKSQSAIQEPSAWVDPKDPQAQIDPRNPQPWGETQGLPQGTEASQAPQGGQAQWSAASQPCGGPQARPALGLQGHVPLGCPHSHRTQVTLP